MKQSKSPGTQTTPAIRLVPFSGQSFIQCPFLPQRKHLRSVTFLPGVDALGGRDAAAFAICRDAATFAMRGVDCGLVGGTPRLLLGGLGKNFLEGNRKAQFFCV